MDGRMRVAARATRKDMSSLFWMVSNANDQNLRILRVGRYLVVDEFEQAQLAAIQLGAAPPTLPSYLKYFTYYTTHGPRVR